MSNQQQLLQYQKAIDQLTGQRDREQKQLDQLEAALTDANQNVQLAKQAGLPAAQIQALELVEKQAFQAAAAQNREAGNTQRPQVTETIVRDAPKINRNDTVTIKHVMSGKTETMKYKKAESMIAGGEWVLVS
jgi:hypothetical protein